MSHDINKKLLKRMTHLFSCPQNDALSAFISVFHLQTHMVFRDEPDGRIGQKHAKYKKIPMTATLKMDHFGKKTGMTFTEAN